MDPIVLNCVRIRNISCPDDERADRKVYSGHLKASEVLKLPVDQNVRGFLLDRSQKPSRRETFVLKAMRETLETRPEDFSVLNGGVVIVASSCDIDESSKRVSLGNASIINGSQTQGVLREYLSKTKDSMGDPFVPSDPYVTFELIVTDDEDIIAEVSVTRNSQNEVRFLSIIGRKGHLDDLGASMRAANPKWQLQLSETDGSQPGDEDKLDTEKLIQILIAITPDRLTPKYKPDGEARVGFNKKDAYNMKTACLRTFEKVKRCSDGESQEWDQKSCNRLYKFFISIAPHVWREYDKWRHTTAFDSKIKKGVKTTRRPAAEAGVVRSEREVSDGIIIPVIAALAPFCKEIGGEGSDEWAIVEPPGFKESDLVDSAVSAFRDIADRKPNVMGKEPSCYSYLLRTTQIFERLNQEHRLVTPGKVRNQSP